MDIGRAFGFITEDEQWVTKILLGGLILLIPIVGILALIGYMLEVARNVTQGRPLPLPAWNNFSDLLIKGFQGFVISLVYQLPLIILSFLVACVFGGIAASASDSNDAAAGAAGILLLCLYPVMFAVGLALQLATFAAWVRYIQTNVLGEALRYNDIIAIVRSSLRTWLMLLLVYILCGLVGGLGSIACGVGALFTTVYAQIAFGHVLGQVTIQMGGTSGYVPPTDAGPGFSSPTY